MAFLVCFKKSDNEDSWQDIAIYLDYEFYKLIFYKQSECQSILKMISNLDYDGTLEIRQSCLDYLRKELESLGSESNHRQIKIFIGVVDKALQANCGLIIAGDMHPVLT